MAEIDDSFSDEPNNDLGYLINNVYLNIILDNVKFSEVIPKIPFARKIAGQVRSLAKQGKNIEAGNMFLDFLKSSDEPGKYQVLMDALKELHYPKIVKAIERGIGDEKKQEEHKKILELFMSWRSDEINPELIANELYSKDILTRNDVDEIRTATKQEGSYWASFELIDLIPRRSENWYDGFLEVLYGHGHQDLCKDIDEKFFDKMKKKPDEYNAIDFPHVSEPNAELTDEETSPSSLSSVTTPEHIVLLNEGNCSCAETIGKQVQDLKTYFEIKFTNLEKIINEQNSLLVKLSQK